MVGEAHQSFFFLKWSVNNLAEIIHNLRIAFGKHILTASLKFPCLTAHYSSLSVSASLAKVFLQLRSIWSRHPLSAPSTQLHSSRCIQVMSRYSIRWLKAKATKQILLAQVSVHSKKSVAALLSKHCQCKRLGCQIRMLSFPNSITQRKYTAILLGKKYVPSSDNSFFE